MAHEHVLVEFVTQFESMPEVEIRAQWCVVGHCHYIHPDEGDVERAMKAVGKRNRERAEVRAREEAQRAFERHIQGVR